MSLRIESFFPISYFDETQTSLHRLDLTENMSFGFGWSVSDVAFLTNVTIKVMKALREEGGAKSEYQRAVRSLETLQATLTEVRKILQHVEPVFRNAISGQLDDSTSSIDQINSKLLAKFSRALGENASNAKDISLPRYSFRKVHWAFSAANELSQFRSQLAEQLDTVKLLMITHVW